MKTQFTPGPWTYNKINGYFVQSDGLYRCRINGPHKGIVAAAYAQASENSDIVMGNAALIAAAPDMFKMLEWLEEECLVYPEGQEDPCRCWAQNRLLPAIRAALQKAQGGK